MAFANGCKMEPGRGTLFHRAGNIRAVASPAPATTAADHAGKEAEQKPAGERIVTANPQIGVAADHSVPPMMTGASRSGVSMPE